ncbi:SgcJ/EcaC family oxidoreductase [Nonomuraea mangrovi]|uniref:SgcJ/EcaC family oxidoreductase n=1 Tax=Nonomuraea mangrovi TaxID=2316207 RepID=A0ABW4SKS8_9ACTN
MTGPDATGVLTALLHAWQRAFNAYHPTEIVLLFSQDALFQGISPRLRRGREEIFEYYDRIAHGTTAEAKLLSAALLGQAILHGFAEVTFTAPTDDIHRIRLSIVAEQAEEAWLIHQYHAATHHDSGSSPPGDTGSPAKVQ